MIVDDYDFLCEKQDLTSGSAYAKNSWFLIAARDWGRRNVPLNVRVLILGPHDNALTIDVVIKENDTAAPKVISSLSIEQPDLVRGAAFNLPVPPIDKRYEYISVQFKVNGVAPADTTTTDGETCPTDPFLHNPKDMPNGVTAFFTHSFPSSVEYPRANVDKVYSS